MTEIDVIMGMLDWNNSAEEQAAGLAQAAQAENFQVFLQPCTEHYNKNVWDNCAKTLAMRSDAELDACLENLLAWLRDMNWPGAFLILERLQAFQNSAALHRAIAGSLLCAQALQIGPLDFVPEENAPADCAARAAEITEPLFAALTESEKSAFPTIPSHRR